RYFPRIERRRFFEQDGARHAVRAARRLRGETFQQRAELREHGTVAKDFRRGNPRRNRVEHRATRIQIRKDQNADIVAVVTGDNDIARKRREVTQDFRAQRTDADPRSAGELEIFGKAAVEEEAFVDVVRIDETQGIAEKIEAVFVEDFLRQLRLAPVPRRDIRAADSRLELAVARDEFQLDAR